MTRSRYITWVGLGLMMALLAGCDNRDKVIDVAQDDPEMLAAIAQARETLPEFWRVFEQRAQGESDFALKVRMTDKHGTEHFWATEIERLNDKTMGTINNDPNIVESVKLGDRIEIAEADVSDWLYMRAGKMVGNRTVRPLFKSMPREEVARIKSIMAEP